MTFLSSPEPSSVFFPQWNLEVHGFSYDAQELTDDRLDSLRAPEDGRRHILLAHGGDEKHLPLHPARIAANGWDYAALGHQHRPALAQDGRVAFPGSPEALDRSETGRTLEGVSLRVNGDRPVKAVYRPGGKPLALADRTASLGKFDVYDMVVVEFK
jgi:DNA repair exonuclease SbcCD nuclease subunit